MFDKRKLKKAKSLLSKDPVFLQITETVEPIFQAGEGNVFNELVKNIVYQQISYKAADTIYNRFVGILKTSKYKPRHILKSDYEVLKSAGLSYQKTQYIFNIAQFFHDHKLYDYDWSKSSDEEIIKLLTEIKGVGVWTVRMILIFELFREDIMPIGDLAVRNVIKEVYGLKEDKKELILKIDEISQAWRPFRSIASLYLWGYRRMQIEQKNNN